MVSSVFSTFYSISLLIGALISAAFQMIGAESTAMALEEADSMALLPLGSVTGGFIQLPQCSRTGSVAQDSPQDYLRVHNVARAEVAVGPLRWDETVAAYARTYTGQLANNCRLVHSIGPFGENIAWSSSNMSGADAVRLWVDEKRFYNRSANSCAPGRVCGHYTQVVWRNSVKVGCAKVSCRNGGTIISCNYDPPGNFVGQRPY